MMRRALLIVATAAGLASTGACGSIEPPAASSPTIANTTTPPSLQLAQFEHGVGVVSSASSEPIWTDADAVAAADGSTVFSIRHDGSDRLVRLDRRTGEVTSDWPLPDGFSISAVAPKGRWIALTVSRNGSTEIVVFDGAAGTETRRLVLGGDLQPEAFSIDGKFIFALDYRGDHYRVQTIELATGRRFDTSDRDKSLAPEDMHGASVRGVLSADGTLLATLYRNPGDDDEPAFVHVLDLEYAWSYCADLPAPFGTGPAGSDVIELTRADTVVVAATQASRIAEIHIDEVHEQLNTPVTVEYRDGTVPSTGSAFRSVPGFVHVIAPISA